MGIMTNVILGGMNKVRKDVANLTIGNVKKGAVAAKSYLKEIKEEAAVAGYENEVETRTIEKLADLDAEKRAKELLAAKEGK